MDRVHALLKQFGRGATSFQALEPGLDYWFDDEEDACVAYAPVSRAWVAAGEPIAPAEATGAVARRFMAAAQQRGRRARFFSVGTQLLTDAGLGGLHIGEEAHFDPQRWPNTLTAVRSLREQIRRATAKGVTVAEVKPAGDARRELDALARCFLRSRAMAPMSFMVQLDLYGYADERRYFMAYAGGEAVEALIAVPIYVGGGWLLEDLLRRPDAPNGTSELLFDTAMRAFAAQGCHHVSYGLAPLAETPTRALRAIKRATSWLYDFDGLRRFKGKLRPASWQPVYLAFDRDERGGQALLDALRAFAGGSLLRFGAETAMHRAPAVTRAIAPLVSAPSPQR